MECRSYLSFQKLFWTVLGCVLPARVDGIRGYAPTQGRSPGMIRGATSGGAEPPPHIGRHSREPGFPHSLDSDRTPGRQHKKSCKACEASDRDCTGGSGT